MVQLLLLLLLLLSVMAIMMVETLSCNVHCNVQLSNHKNGNIILRLTHAYYVVAITITRWTSPVCNWVYADLLFSNGFFADFATDTISGKY